MTLPLRLVRPDERRGDRAGAQIGIVREIDVFQRREEPSEHGQRVAAEVGHRGVGHLPPHLDAEFDPPPVSATDLVPAGLADEDEVGPQRVRHVAGAESSDLLLYRSRHVDIAGRAPLRGDEAGDAVHLRRERALDVDRTPSPQQAVVYLAAIGVVRPVRRIPGVHMVEVGVEHHRGRVAGSPEETDDVARCVMLDLVVTERAHLGGDEPGQFAFFAGHRLCADEPLEEPDAGVESLAGQLRNGAVV